MTQAVSRCGRRACIRTGVWGSLGRELISLREQGAFGSVGYRVVAIGRLSMGMLMLRCPMTDQNFSPGIYADKGRFKSMLDTERVVLCPQCGREHRWRPRDAWLVECVNGRVSIACDNPRPPPDARVVASSPPAFGPEVFGICRIEEVSHSVVSRVRGYRAPASTPEVEEGVHHG